MPSCYRRLSFIAALLLSALVCFVGTVPAAELTTKQIAQWIEQLGDNDFKVRENASKNLWEAGAAAESALEKALKSDDPEVARRARDLLDKFHWGIYADTPANIVALIRAYQSSEGNARMEVLQKLLHGGDAGLRAILKIAKAVKEESKRQELSAFVANQLPAAFLQAVTEAKYEKFEKLLELGHEGKFIEPAQYAAYWLLRGKLAERIDHFRSQLSKHPDDKWSAQTLAYLHRANGDLAEARKTAEKSKLVDLLSGILYEMGDWKALSAYAESAPTHVVPSKEDIHHVAGMENSAEKWAYRAAYSRLAGRQKELDNAVRELRKFAESKEERESLAFVAAKTLLLNDRPMEGLQLLDTVNKAIRFDILCTRLDFGKALKLSSSSGAAKKPDTLDFAKARILCLLGEKEQAEALFKRLAEHDVGPSWAYGFLQEEYRAGLKELAFEHCAKVLGAAQKKKVGNGAAGTVESGAANYLGQVFPQQAREAEVWWEVFRLKFKEESAAARLKRLRQLLEGKVAAEEVKAWVEEANTLLSQPTASISAMRLSAYRQALAETAVKARLDDLAYSLLEKVDLPVALIRLGDLLAAKKQWEKAAQRYQQAWKKALTPEKPRANRVQLQLTGMQQSYDPLPLYLAGDALVRAGREKEGKKYIEQAHWLPLADAATRFNFLRVLAERGHKEAARRETDLLLRVSEPNSYESGAALRRQAVAALARKDYLKAAEGFEQSMLRCLRANTNFVSNALYATAPAQIHQLRASGLLAAGKLDEALKQADLALNASPGSVDVPIALVPELERHGHKKEAADLFNRCYAVYEKVCRAYPRCAWAHNSMAWLSACCRRHLDEALTHAEKAVELAPSHAGYLDTLAEVHFQRGDKNKAIAMQKRAIELDPKRSYYRKQLKRLQAGDPNAERPPENED